MGHVIYCMIHGLLSQRAKGTTFFKYVILAPFVFFIVI